MNTGTEPVVVIGGGVGPMAGIALHARIIENTLTDGTDQSHLCVHHYSCPAMVPDRTGWLLRHAAGFSGEAGAAAGDPAEDPAAGMARVFEKASRALNGQAAVGGVPGNTFHAPAIFDRFLAMLREAGLGIRIINMLDETIDLLRERLGPAQGQASGLAAGGMTIGLLSTTGTRRSGVYDRLLAKAGYSALYVSEADQASLHASIYDQSWGIKATSSPSGRAKAVVSDLASGLVAGGASAVILACTELPLALGGTAISGDPVLALARALVREAAPDKLKPLF